MMAFLKRLRPQIMVAILSLTLICLVAMVANGGSMSEIATAGVTGIILLAREVTTQDSSGDGE